MPTNTGYYIQPKLKKVTDDGNEYPLDENNELVSVSGLPQDTMDNPTDSPTYKVLDEEKCPQGVSGKWIADETSAYCEQDDEPEQPPFTSNNLRGSNLDSNILYFGTDGSSTRTYDIKTELFAMDSSFINGETLISPTYNSGYQAIRNEVTSSGRFVDTYYKATSSVYSPTGIYAKVDCSNVINSTEPKVASETYASFLNHIDFKKFFTDFPSETELYFRSTFTKTAGSPYQKRMVPGLLAGVTLAANNNNQVGLQGTASRNHNFSEIFFDQKLTVSGRIVKINMNSFNFYFDTEVI